MDWYEEKIEEPIRELVRYLRNAGVNTECSCGHKMYIQCQYIPEGEIMRIHGLLFDYFNKIGKPLNYTIVATHKVVNGCGYSSMDIKLEPSSFFKTSMT